VIKINHYKLVLAQLSCIALSLAHLREIEFHFLPMFHFLTNLKIDLQRTLFTGQTFLWTRQLNEYYYVLQGNLISLKTTETGIYFKIHHTFDGVYIPKAQKMPHTMINPNYSENLIVKVEGDEGCAHARQTEQENDKKPLVVKVKLEDEGCAHAGQTDQENDKKPLVVKVKLEDEGCAHAGQKSQRREDQEPAANKRVKIESDDLVSRVRQDLHIYFHLDIDFEALVEEWSKDPVFKSKTKNIKYSRMLNQDPVETIFQFICSQNNNIKRITQLCRTISSFGSYLCNIDGKDYYRFPTLEQLSLKTEQNLRDSGFGYRASYIEKTCRFLLDNPTFINDLLLKDYKDAKIDLLSLHGVGPKVADCICLFGLDKRDCIPVDTHVWKIATVDYKMKMKKLTPKTYEEIGDFFRHKFTFAGWAHTLLFVGDLKSDSLGNLLDLEQREE
jgi:8-oxoguanine DNA-glycosylase Ogg